MQTIDPKSLYEEDFHLWAEQTAGLLRQQRWSELDVKHLIEEVEDLGKSQQRALRSSLRLVLIYLLKWQYQPERRSDSWENTIARERLNIEEYLEDMPSLKRFLTDSDWVEKVYRRSRKEATFETKLPLATFPEQCPFTLEQILDEAFWPE